MTHRRLSSLVAGLNGVGLNDVGLNGVGLNDVGLNAVGLECDLGFLMRNDSTTDQESNSL